MLRKPKKQNIYNTVAERERKWRLRWAAKVFLLNTYIIFKKKTLYEQGEQTQTHN